MKKNVFLCAGFALTASTAFAGPGGNQPRPEPRPIRPKIMEDCEIDENDPFDREERMPAGPHKGLCIDTSIHRSVRSVDEATLRDWGIRDVNVTAMANFRHDEKFWVAVVPNEIIVDAMYQVFFMTKAVPITHGQLRLRLNHGGRKIRLIEQKRTPPRKSIVLEEDIVFAEYGVRAKGHDENFNALHGVIDQYSISFVFQSLSQASKWAFDSKIKVNQYVLDLETENVRKVLAKGIELGTENGMQTPYNTFTASCHNTVFMVLHEILRELYGDQAPRDRGATSQSIHPVQNLQHLGLLKKGDIDEIPNRTLDLKDEFEGQENAEKPSLHYSKSKLLVSSP